MSRASRLLSVPAVLAALALAATGCSTSGTASADGSASFDGAWGGADEVIASVGDAGFDCSFDTSKNLKQVLTEHSRHEGALGRVPDPVPGVPKLLLDDPAAYTASIKKDCATVTKESLESPAMSRVVVVGERTTSSRGPVPDHAYPEGLLRTRWRRPSRARSSRCSST